MALDFGHEALTYPAVTPFGGGKPMLKARKEGDDLKWLLGGKGANLARMGDIGLCVPPGFTLTTEVCRLYEKVGSVLPEFVWEQVKEGIKHVESATNSTFGSGNEPLLLSVRSGAAISMPGMMDTVLNLGLNDVTVEALAAKTNNPRFAYDSYRRFLDMYGDVVMNIPHSDFETELKLLKTSVGAKEDSDLNTEHLKHVVHLYKMVFKRHQLEFPTDPMDQLRQAICAVFNSWQSDRARTYMKVQGIKGLLGTAVNVQAMAFGNMGDNSCTGVLFTRNPNTGENVLFGEYLINAQGEDVVAGIRTPKPIAQLQEDNKAVYDELLENCRILERNLKDMQDVEFTVQENKLYMLQTRNGKRGGKAAVRIAVEMVQEGLLTREEGLLLVTPSHLDIMLHPQFDNLISDEYKKAVAGKGLPASPGAAVGKVCFSTEHAEQLHASGIPAILVRDETSPEDVAGMYAATGILTARGGMTSHAAVVARGWGKPCIVGLGELDINEHSKIATLGSTIIREGDTLSLNGATGEVLIGSQPMSPPALEGTLSTFMSWVDDFRTMTVLANADAPQDAAEARRQGACGIGLCRTEHMFFDYINDVRRMILAPTEGARQAAVNRLLPLQRSDFEGILEAMDGLPVTIRLLDPPLHEFLPPQADAEVAEAVGLSVSECQNAIDRMREANPMLGLRGCRLGITQPGIVAMQTRAVVEAAFAVKAKGMDPRPQIMVPLVGTVKEFEHQRDIIRSTIAEIFEEKGDKIEVKIGTMIETPRAALIAGKIAAAGAEFFSFGTNDLTQMTFGYSRDDVGAFLPVYLQQNILPADPFQVFDTEGVGELVQRASEQGKAANPELHIGVCGEHGGEPSSIHFFNSLKHDYVSCSTFRVPIARLAAAQAAVTQKKN